MCKYCVGSGFSPFVINNIHVNAILSMIANVRFCPLPSGPDANETIRMWELSPMLEPHQPQNYTIRAH